MGWSPKLSWASGVPAEKKRGFLEIERKTSFTDSPHTEATCWVL